LKILLLSHSFYPAIGGIESISEMLAEEFIAAGHEVRLITRTKFDQQEIFSYQIIRDPGFFTIVKSILWCDVIFENNLSLRMSWPNVFLRKPLITGIQTWIADNNGKTSLLNTLKKLWIGTSTVLVACSEAVKKSTYERAIVIGNPYNEKIFKKDPSVTVKKDFVFLGRLVSDKGAGLALEAFKHFAAEHKGSSLTIIGGGPERENLEAKVKLYGLEQQVIFEGPLRGQQIVEILNRHIYLLVPSIWREPFGIVALEGLACGCIPIVSDGGGLPEAVGEAGLVFKRGDADDLYRQMSAVYADPKLRLKLEQASNEQLRRHSSRYVAQDYMNVFEKFVKYTR